jgi:hypothetical protein
MAESISLIDNVLARDLLGDDTRIFAYNHPLPKGTASKIQDIRSDITGFNIASNIIVGMSFLIAWFGLIFLCQTTNHFFGL